MRTTSRSTSAASAPLPANDELVHRHPARQQRARVKFLLWQRSLGVWFEVGGYGRSGVVNTAASVPHSGECSRRAAGTARVFAPTPLLRV